MTNLQAALGVAQMEELDEFIRRKNINYGLYQELFKNFEYGRIVPFRKGTRSNKWFYSLEINRDKIKASMREIITGLEKRNVGTRAIWGLINEQRPYQGEITYKIEKAPYYAERILNIPCSTNLTEGDIKFVYDTIKDFFKELAND
jgi:perosamine synthetase